MGLRLLDRLQALINEHGSAVILKERIALLTDRLAEAERKLKDASLEVTRLEANAKALQAEVDEVRRLQKDANDQSQSDLTPEREAVLRAVCFNPGSSADAIAAIASTSGHQAEWHLDHLLISRLVLDLLIARTDWGEGGRLWSIAPDGRDYLARRNLLQP